MKGEVLGMGSSETGEITVVLREGGLGCIDVWALSLIQASGCESDSERGMWCQQEVGVLLALRSRLSEKSSMCSGR